MGKTNCHLETAVEPSANCLITDPDDPGEFEHLLSRCRQKCLSGSELHERTRLKAPLLENRG